MRASGSIQPYLQVGLLINKIPHKIKHRSIHTITLQLSLIITHHCRCSNIICQRSIIPRHRHLYPALKIEALETPLSFFFSTLPHLSLGCMSLFMTVAGLEFFENLQIGLKLQNLDGMPYSFGWLTTYWVFSVV